MSQSVSLLCDHHKIAKLRYILTSWSHDLAQGCSQSLRQNAVIDLITYTSVMGTHWMGLHYAYTKHGWRCERSWRSHSFFNPSSQWREYRMYTASAIAGIGVYIRVEYDLSHDNAPDRGELCGTASQYTNLRLTRFIWEPYLRWLLASNTEPTQPQRTHVWGMVALLENAPATVMDGHVRRGKLHPSVPSKTWKILTED